VSALVTRWVTALRDGRCRVCQGRIARGERIGRTLDWMYHCETCGTDA
jgi:hypothetical protein